MQVGTTARTKLLEVWPTIANFSAVDLLQETKPRSNTRTKADALTYGFKFVFCYQ